MRSIRSFVYVAFVLATMAIFSACAGAGVTEPTRVTQCETGSIAPQCLTSQVRLGPSAEIRLKMADNPEVDSPVVAQRQFLNVDGAGPAVGTPVFTYSMTFNMDNVGSVGGGACVYMSDDGINSKGDAIGCGRILQETNTYVPDGSPTLTRGYVPFNYFLVRGDYGINGVGRKYFVGAVPAQ